MSDATTESMIGNNRTMPNIKQEIDNPTTPTQNYQVCSPTTTLQHQEVLKLNIERARISKEYRLWLISHGEDRRLKYNIKNISSLIRVDRSQSMRLYFYVVQVNIPATLVSRRIAKDIKVTKD